MARKIGYNEVKAEIENLGWDLISTEYVNLKTDLEVKCSEGHLNYIPFSRLRTGSYECPVCKQNKLYKVNNVAIKKTGYRILAFDQASITSGWALYDGQQLLKYGKWTSDGSSSTDRISRTKYWFASLISKFNPDEIILEDIQLQKFKSGEEAAVTVYKKLAHLQGVLSNYLYERGYNFQVVAPATWRAHSEIKGKDRQSKKRNAQLKIKEIYDISVSQDEADAILIGKWAADCHKKGELIQF